jgi:hypothetical protein
MINNITNIESTMNARKELEEILNKLKEKQNVLVCADISYEGDWGESIERIRLTHPHTKEEAETFFKALDFNYNNGYGTQELYGTVWLTYGVWLSRWEYDGSEGWQVNNCPHIPDYLYKKSLDK